MITLQVFDRPMCCSTGICGPNVDPVLPRFAADLEWLKSQGVSVERFNLSQQPAAFVQNEDVKAALANENVTCLPLVRLNGQIVFKGDYPSRSMLANWCGVKTMGALPVVDASCCEPSSCYCERD